jgi:hypothetical protein
MRFTITLAMLAGLAFTVPAVHAAELSPWLGSADQIPFQLDPVTMVAVTFAADPLQTGSTGKSTCGPPHCILTAKPAMEIGKAVIAPQN